MISGHSISSTTPEVIQERPYWERFTELFEVNFTPGVFLTSFQIIVFLAILIFFSVDIDMKSLALALGMSG